MSKNEFLDSVSSEFLARHPRWAVVHENRRAPSRVVGLEVDGMVLLLVDFSCRPDNMRVHHGVGWSRNKATFLADLKSTDMYPKARDGSLRRLQKLSKPRDFEHEAMNVSVGLLHKPFDGFDLATESPEYIQATMLQEIEDYAFPYLCMMLKARHDLELTPAQL